MSAYVACTMCGYVSGHSPSCTAGVVEKMQGIITAQAAELARLRADAKTHRVIGEEELIALHRILSQSDTAESDNKAIVRAVLTIAEWLAPPTTTGDTE